MDRPIKILALAGSYRQGSLNQALLSAAHDEAPETVQLTDFDLRSVPFYDGDVESAGLPPEVQRLKDAVADADALLLVTPEYNGGIPAVLKNGIDWTSRMYPNAPIGGKLSAIIGASPGRGGTRQAQEQLRQVLTRAGAVVIDAPEIMVARASNLIVDGRVESDELRAVIRDVVDSLSTAVEVCLEEGTLAPAV
jgi:chromate reductase